MKRGVTLYHYLENLEMRQNICIQNVNESVLYWGTVAGVPMCVISGRKVLETRVADDGGIYMCVFDNAI